MVAIASPALAQSTAAPGGAGAAQPSTPPQTQANTTIAPAQAGPAAAASNQTTVGEVIVVAQRVAQRLQDVPVAVTAVSPQELENRRLHELPQLTLAVPSLQVTTDNAFTIRGIGSQIFSQNVDSSVGVMVDDVSLGVPLFMSNAAFLDVGQIEVLTGPQGLLFGRNSSAGLINIITNRPKLNDYSGMASLEYDGRDAPGGNFGLVATGVVNLPTSSNSALRLDVLESDQDPVVAERVNTSPDAQLNQERTQAKAKWLWRPQDNLTVYLIADFSRERGVGGIWDFSFRQVGGSSIGTSKADGVTAGPNNLYAGVSAPDFRSVDTGGVSANISYNINPALTLSDIVAWRAYSLNYNLDSDISSSPTGLDINEARATYNQYSNELRLAFKQPRFDGQVGLYGFWSVNSARSELNGELQTGVPEFILGTNNYKLNDRSLAVYGQANFHVTSNFTLIAGGRVTNDQIHIGADADNFSQTLTSTPLGTLPVPLVLADGPLGQAYDEQRSNTNFSYKGGAQYNLARDIMFYATYSTGYKGPAFATNLAYVGQDPYIKPETATDIEVGMKAILLDRKLRLNIAGYDEKFTNFQAQSFTPNGVQVLGNAGGVRSEGVEFSATLKPVNHITVDYNSTLQRSYFTDYATDPCYTEQAPAACPGGVFFQGAGIPTPASARYTGTLEAIYDTQISETMSMSLSGNWYHRSSVNFSSAGSPYTELGPIDVFGANLAFRSDKGYEVAIFCKNCTNEIYPNFIATYPGDTALGAVTTYNQWGYNSVRTVGASFTYRF